jgi:hypothetical protein
LFGDHYNGLDGKSASAVVEEVLQGRSEKVNYQNVVETFLAEVVDIRNAGYLEISDLLSGIVT